MVIIKKEDLLKGRYENLIFNDNKIMLKEKEIRGIYESEVLNTIEFKELIASWNGHTTQNSSIEIQVKIRKGDVWSRWFTYGKWSDRGYNKGSVNGQRDDIAQMAIDVIKVKSLDKCSALKYKIILERTNNNFESPDIRLVSFTFNPYNKTSKQEFDGFDIEIDIDVPMRSQKTVPEIGGIICSPTSLSMVMEYLGVNEEIVEVAAGVKDNGSEKYGNWSYNTAYAGERGFESYVKKCESIKDVKEILLKGIPVAASIRTSSQEDLEGSFCAHESGHLLVIRGFIQKDGEDYVIVNDPAAPTNEMVRREYKLSQFVKAWSKIIYVVRKTK